MCLITPDEKKPLCEGVCILLIIKGWRTSSRQYGFGHPMVFELSRGTVAHVNSLSGPPTFNFVQ